MQIICKIPITLFDVYNIGFCNHCEALMIEINYNSLSDSIDTIKGRAHVIGTEFAKLFRWVFEKLIPSSDIAILVKLIPASQLTNPTSNFCLRCQVYVDSFSISQIWLIQINKNFCHTIFNWFWLNLW